MIAYDIILIKNLAILKKAKHWYSQQLISTQQMRTIQERYKTAFYNPNLIIKIGLFIFTWVAISAAMGFYSMFFSSLFDISGKGFMVFSSFFFSGVCVFSLELFIKQKKIYRSGVDECLLYSALAFLFAGVGITFSDIFDSQNNFLLINIIAVPFLIATTIRYSDRFVSFLLGISVYAIFFLLLLKTGNVAKMIMPFALMLLSVPIYLGAKKQKVCKELFYWKHNLAVLECLALLIFYLACNYFVIRESSIAFFDMKLKEGEDIPLSVLFYVLTASVPVLYVYYGLKKKDKLLLRVGLILIAATILTFKYYFDLGHPEITLTILGMLMIAGAYSAIQYLKTPKHGLTFKEEEDEDNFLKSNAEALIIAQSFTQQSTSQSDTEFGGGSFGGAGSGDAF